METLLTLQTERLLLRPFTADDRSAVQAILGDQTVTRTLLDIPYPFTSEDADFWIRAGHAGIQTNLLFPFAMTRRADGLLIGCIDIELQPEHRRGDIAYWLAPAHWGQGYTTEAARRIIQFGFEDLGLNRVYAQCLRTNVASARVMQKAGLRYEATLRHSTIKDSAFVDIDVYGLLRTDFPT
ncbi:MAG: GNAT family N-acetyltransferase [Anaerolineae bacterium]|nr:GNAT family N-acetyltransferase [Anaerolineae bacterium]